MENANSQFFNLGGLIQAMLNGFGGLEITSNGIIQVKSKLPAQWKSLKLTGIGIDKKTYLVKTRTVGFGRFKTIHLCERW